MNRYITFLFSILLTSNITAQTFKTEKLAKAVSVIGVTLPNKLLLGQSIELRTSDGLPINVRTNVQGEIEHIGVALFNPQMRSLMPSPVYDFMEYAVLNWRYKVNPNQLYLSKVIFKKGSWNSLLTERLNECECNISNQENRLYIIHWSQNGKDVAIVGIPIEYELLNNDSRRNMERDFIRLLSAYHVAVAEVQSKNVTENDLKIYGTEGLFVIPGQSHIVAELNQNVYYQLTTTYETVDTVIRGKHERMTLEDVVPAIVSDINHPAESFANLMIACDRNVPDVQMELDFHLSNYLRKTVSLPLSKLRDYLHTQGCDLYFACSGYTKDTVRGMLFANNPAKGYNHLFSLNICSKHLQDKHPKVKADVYLYIPPIDKSRLFGKTPTKKSGVNIYQ